VQGSKISTLPRNEAMRLDSVSKVDSASRQLRKDLWDIQKSIKRAKAEIHSSYHNDDRQPAVKLMGTSYSRLPPFRSSDINEQRVLAAIRDSNSNQFNMFQDD
jgi:hypothetical protein